LGEFGAVAEVELFEMGAFCERGENLVGDFWAMAKVEVAEGGTTFLEEFEEMGTREGGAVGEVEVIVGMDEEGIEEDGLGLFGDGGVAGESFVELGEGVFSLVEDKGLVLEVESDEMVDFFEGFFGKVGGLFLFGFGEVLEALAVGEGHTDGFGAVAAGDLFDFFGGALGRVLDFEVFGVEKVADVGGVSLVEADDGFEEVEGGDLFLGVGS
jgi:hypothetical protein